ncbi:hypothetical protein [Lachnospira multipara]|uniref:hypothetical protein n=1 Tax=Lachnospira multipara TaxID=28051 RepID=UPI0004817B21|nr:hypothetical protein [Lachnospira multipara]
MEKIILDPIDKKEALRYLGYRNTKLDDNILSLIDECEERVRQIATPRYVYKVFDFEEKEDGIILEDTNLYMKGNSITNHLKNCEKAIGIAVTIGEGIDREIRVLSHTNLAKSVVFDAFASACVEQVCEKVEDILRKEFKGLNMTFRFGIGYGDLSLSYQKNFIKVLDATRKIGINVGTTDMMIPTKSVTAIIGLTSKEIPRMNRNCRDCNLNGNCNIQKSGNRCM